MKCKKCRKQISDDSKFCNYCGAPQKKDKMYRRPDGLYEKVLTIDGKRVPFRAKTEKEVNRKIAEFQGIKERGPLFKEVAENWQNEHFPTITYNTQKSYTAPFSRAVEQFGDTPIRNIKPNDINSFIGLFARKGMSQKTVRNQLLVINLIFSYALVNGDVDGNPAEYVEPPKNLAKHKRELPSDETIELVKSSIDAPFGLLAYFLLYTGCRIGEALALQYSDIDFKNKVIHITKSLYHQNNIPKIKTPKTEAGKRDIILLDILAEKLPRGKPKDYLFPGDNGEPMTYSCFKHGWNAYCKAIGMYTTYVYVDKNGRSHSRITPGLTAHQLRHGFATILFEAGIDEKDAQELLGHSSISVTKDTYTHIRKSRRDKTAKILNEYTVNSQ